MPDRAPSWDCAVTSQPGPGWGIAAGWLELQALEKKAGAVGESGLQSHPHLKKMCLAPIVPSMLSMAKKSPEVLVEIIHAFDVKKKSGRTA